MQMIGKDARHQISWWDRAQQSWLWISRQERKLPKAL